MIEFDLTQMDDEDLALLGQAVTSEQQRRWTLASAAGRMEELTRTYLEAQGVEEGEPWRQPTGAHDAYPLGWVVTHNGQTWESLIAGNVWEPGVSGWRIKGDDNPWPAWVQPTGAHDAYDAGAQVTHNDLRWVSDVNGNVWEPGVHGWTEVVDE